MKELRCLEISHHRRREPGIWRIAEIDRHHLPRNQIHRRGMPDTARAVRHAVRYAVVAVVVVVGGVWPVGDMACCSSHRGGTAPAPTRRLPRNSLLHGGSLANHRMQTCGHGARRLGVGGCPARASVGLGMGMGASRDGLAGEALGGGDFAHCAASGDWRTRRGLLPGGGGVRAEGSGRVVDHETRPAAGPTHCFPEGCFWSAGEGGIYIYVY